MITWRRLTWSAFASWRFRGLRPHVFVFGAGAPEPDAAREAAVLSAFAEHAATLERAVLDLAGAFAGQDSPD